MCECFADHLSDQVVDVHVLRADVPAQTQRILIERHGRIAEEEMGYSAGRERRRPYEVGKPD